MRRFTVLCAGYFASMTGTALTAFALTVWIYLETGSTIQFAFGFVLSLLPAIVLSPFAGALVDRWDRRTVMLASDMVGVGTTVTLATVAATGVLQPWHIFITIAVRSAMGAFLVPALNASVTQLAPRTQLGRANGMVMTATAVSQTVAPALGGLLIVAIGLPGILLIDCLTFLLNIAILVQIRIPQPAPAGVSAAGLLGEIGQGWRYLGRRRALLPLLAFYAALNLAVGFVDVLFTPLVIGMASVAALGAVLSVGGIGMVLGGVAMATWGGPPKRIHGIAGLAVPLGLFLCLGALRPNVVLVAIAAFGFQFCSMIIEGTSRSVLQMEVEPGMQGRAFAAFNMATNTVLFTGYMLAGPVSERIFDPLLRAGGPLTDTVGTVIGVGPGRGSAFLILLLGLFVLVVAALGYLSSGLRALRDDAPLTAPTSTGAASAGRPVGAGTAPSLEPAAGTSSAGR
ncbi:putative MFS family arabinose efflux permease [Mumia flava]|uniref:Putative MFS family arabinose efflux permease n=1 Tax=Mumia flava TaxID=1348852 RepID=A0A2M9B838_9ACTN|nr:MFS transporter [Mumia flava]PJJ54104.1 putative MFS family arabinose efflux permease [Mumia flava]